MAVLLIALVVGILIAFFAANEFYEIAKMKGHPQRKYFWWCFLVGMVGWPMVIALPDRAGAQQQAAAAADDELPDL